MLDFLSYKNKLKSKVPTSFRKKDEANAILDTHVKVEADGTITPIVYVREVEIVERVKIVESVEVVEVVELVEVKNNDESIVNQSQCLRGRRKRSAEDWSIMYSKAKRKIAKLTNQLSQANYDLQQEKQRLCELAKRN